MGKEIALTCEHVSIDYRDISNMSLAKSLKKGGIKKAEIFRAVNDISFEVNKGEILGIVGQKEANRERVGG